MGEAESSTKCERCQKHEATEPHACPYQQEIHDEPEFLCNCCEDCKQECRDAI